MSRSSSAQAAGAAARGGGSPATRVERAALTEKMRRGRHTERVESLGLLWWWKKGGGEREKKRGAVAIAGSLNFLMQCMA